MHRPLKLPLEPVRTGRIWFQIRENRIAIANARSARLLQTPRSFPAASSNLPETVTEKPEAAQPQPEVLVPVPSDEGSATTDQFSGVKTGAKKVIRIIKRPKVAVPDSNKSRKPGKNSDSKTPLSNQVHFNPLKYQVTARLFCSTGLPLARTRWVRPTF